MLDVCGIKARSPAREASALTTEPSPPEGMIFMTLALVIKYDNKDTSTKIWGYTRFRQVHNSRALKDTSS